MVSDTGGPVFPVEPTGNGGPFHQGMTLRDHFAAVALAGIIPTAAAPCLHLPQQDCALVAETAYAIADAMLAERAK